MTFREWMLECRPCEKIYGKLAWDYDLDEQTCPSCGALVDLYIPERGKAPGLVTDDIPGGIEIRHLDPRPRVYYSKTDIKRACNEKGFTWADDTPKPYRVAWSGKSTSHDDRKRSTE